MPKFQKISRSEYAHRTKISKVLDPVSLVGFLGIFFVDGKRAKKGLAREREDVEVCSCKTADLRKAKEWREKIAARSLQGSTKEQEEGGGVEELVKGCGGDCLNRVLQIACDADNCSYQVALLVLTMCG